MYSFDASSNISNYSDPLMNIDKELFLSRAWAPIIPKILILPISLSKLFNFILHFNP